MCEQCRNEHQKNQETNEHELVAYRQRKPQLPVEKCKLHPSRLIDVFCNDCSAPLCSKCIFRKEHAGHKFDELEEKLAVKFACCQTEIFKIRTYFFSTSKNLKIEIQEDSATIKKIMNGIRDSIQAEAESIKELVDRVTLKKQGEVKKMKKSLTTMLKSQETFDIFIKYLVNLDNEFNSYLSLNNIRGLISENSENFEIKPIPETSKPVLPVFTTGRVLEDDIYKLFGNINIPNTNPDIRPIKPMESASTHLKPRLSYFVTITGVHSVFHVSLGKSGTLWVSDSFDNLVQTDPHGNQLREIQTSGTSESYHTVTQDGDLIYTDKRNKVINWMAPNNTITEIIKTGDWVPYSIQSSHNNEDILVGMKKNKDAKVARFSKTGTEIQSIHRDTKGQELYSLPHYITENINGDVCVADYEKEAVVVVNKSGQHRFNNTGLIPYGICTDILGHILVCNCITDAVHLLAVH